MYGGFILIIPSNIKLIRFHIRIFQGMVCRCAGMAQVLNIFQWTIF